MYLNKWLTFTAAALIQCNTGLTYCFSIYAPHLKEQFGFSQTQLEEVGFAVIFGGSFAIIPGNIYDILEDHHLLGPRVVVWIGALVCFVGYFGLYLCTQGLIRGGFMVVAIFAFLAGNTGAWIDTAALVTNVRNFPTERGTVVGVLKSFVGLSGSLYTTIYLGIFAPDPTSFLLFIALGVPTLCLVMSAFINHVPHVQHGELEAGEDVWLSSKGRFLMAYGLVAALSLYQMTSALLAAELPVGSGERQVALGGMLILLGCVFLVGIRSGGCASHRVRLHSVVGSPRASSPRTPALGDFPHLGASPFQVAITASSARIRGTPEGPHDDTPKGASPKGSSPDLLRQPLLAPRPHDLASDLEEPILSPFEVPAAGPELSTLQAMQTPAFWLLFLQFLVGTGCGLAYLNNLGQLTHALGAPEGGQVVLVSLFSVANAAGRLLTGLVPERLLHSHGVPRTCFLAAAATAMSAACLFTAYSSLSSLALASLMLGVSFGSHWTLIPAITSDLYGLRHFASNYTTLQLAMILGSYSLGTRLPGFLYDEQARAQGGSGRDCRGAHCFRTAFLLLSAAAAVSACSTILLAWFTRGLYRAVGQQLQRADEEFVEDS